MLWRAAEEPLREGVRHSTDDRDTEHTPKYRTAAGHLGFEAQARFSAVETAEVSCSQASFLARASAFYEGLTLAQGGLKNELVTS